MKFISSYRNLRFLLLSGIMVSMMLSCGKKKQTESTDQHYVIADSLFRTLTLDTVKYAPMIDALKLTGTVDFDQDKMVHIYPLVSGNIQGIKVMLGDYVQAGQVLGYIKSTDVADMNSSLVNAETNLTVAKKNRDAAADMFKSGLSSQSELLAAQSSYAQAVAELQRIKQVMHINGTGSGAVSVIKSPISGFVVEKFVTNNTIIRSDNSNPLFTISDLKNVWVMANVYESNIGKIKAGDRADITTLSYPGRVFHGKINELLNVLDPESKVLKVKIVLPNPDYALKPQMFTSVNVIQNEGRQAIAIPSNALVFDNSQYYVLVVKNPKDIRIQPVQVLGTVGDITYIQSGIEPGEILIGSQALLIYGAMNG